MLCNCGRLRCLTRWADCDALRPHPNPKRPLMTHLYACRNKTRPNKLNVSVNLAQARLVLLTWWTEHKGSSVPVTTEIAHNSSIKHTHIWNCSDSAPAGVCLIYPGTGLKVGRWGAESRRAATDHFISIFLWLFPWFEEIFSFNWSPIIHCISQKCSVRKCGLFAGCHSPVSHPRNQTLQIPLMSPLWY